ncbi:proteasome regulatory particle base subunit [Pichia californica]|nr:proteasome regulatory particle base subunit [[Candida] californica]
MAPVNEKESAPAAEQATTVTKTVVTSKDSKDKDQKKKQEEELSEEDQQLKSELEMLVERLISPQSELYESALHHLKIFIRDSTSSMTAVPKPLKFLRPFYPALVQLDQSWKDKELLKQLYDILSVLGMTYSEEDGEEYVRECLKYRLKSYIDESMTEWGHEYLRHLSLELGEQYSANLNSGETNDELFKLSDIVAPYFLKHNAEVEAVDLLLEIEQVEKLSKYVDKNTFKRVCSYMVACVPLLAPPDDLAFLNTAFTIYLENNRLTEALTLAIRLGDDSLIKSVFESTADISIQKQLGFILGKQNYGFNVENEEVQQCINNNHAHRYFQYLVTELNLLTPKVPEDIYKSHLETSFYASSSKLESAKQNLAAAFVNGFLNAGYSDEKLISNEKWVYKTKDEGMLSTIASLGLVNLWNVENGLQQLDQYQYSDATKLRAGAVLGMGISTNGVHDDVESTYYLLEEFVHNREKDDSLIVTSAITGLGIAYAGSENENVLNLLAPIVSDPNYTLEIQALSALALGHTFVGTCNGEITDTILQSLLDMNPVQLTSKWIRFMVLGLSLLYMGKYDQIDDVLQTIEAIQHPIADSLNILIHICSYAGTGNVLKIQELLHECTTKPTDGSDEEDDEDYEDDDDDDEDDEGLYEVEASANAAVENELENNGGVMDVDNEDNVEVADMPIDIHNNNIEGGNESTTIKSSIEKKESEIEDVKTDIINNEESSSKKKEKEETIEDDLSQGFSVLGLALICLGEEVGQEMSIRHFEHLMHYGKPIIKRAVPLAMGLVSTSNAQMNVFETLSRYSHDQDLEVAYNAIFSMGLVGAGTNNARLAQLLRQLASYYINDQNGLFISRISQGLVHLGKGTLTMSPFSTDKQILSKVSLAGLLTVCIALLDPKSFILDQNSNLLYYLTPAIKPRMLVTVDENLEPIKVNVRVGQAVDTVGAAGKPKTITGWVTHSTPVLLGFGERAELETDEYISYASSMEGVVILKKNPDYVTVE